MMFLRFFALCILSTLLFSCAGVIHGTKQSVTIESTPNGAEVFIDGNSMGKTPLVVKLKKNKYDNIMVKLSGHKTVTRDLEKSYDPITLLNIIWDSSTTDMITGAAYEYEPNKYHFNLEQEQNQKK